MREMRFDYGDFAAISKEEFEILRPLYEKIFDEEKIERELETAEMFDEVIAPYMERFNEEFNGDAALKKRFLDYVVTGRVSTKEEYEEVMKTLTL